jgi:cardiolipin synthase
MTWLAAHFTVVLGTFLATIAAVMVLQQRRTPQSSAAWLLAIVALPYLAIPLFLGLGFRKQGPRFRPIRFGERPEKADMPPPHKLAGVLGKFGIPAATGGNRFCLLDTPQTAHDRLLAMILESRTSIDAMFYAVADDAVGVAFVHALASAARRGVRVRLLMDRLGALRRPRQALAELALAGGTVKYASPFLHALNRGHLNLRNHRKMLIADRAAVFSGGMNVGADYMGQPKAGAWVDIAYFLEGPEAARFCDVFDADFGASGAPVSQPDAMPAQTKTNATVQLLPSGPDIPGDPLHDGLVYAIHTAETRIWLATPYFLPTEMLGSALAIAARRGVDVRIILPAHSNQRLADFARGAYVRELAQAGCRVLLFRPGMMHAKCGVIDGLGYVGSANFDVRSMLLNFETTLVVFDTASVQLLVDWFARIAPDCGDWAAPGGLLRRVSEGVFRLGAPVL